MGKTNKHILKKGITKTKKKYTPLSRTNNTRYKKMNCNPSVKGKTIDSDSCLTPEVIIKIKDSFNKHHIDNPITEKEPKELWYELKNRLNSCSKEDCWLEQIDNTKLREQIDRMTFAPDKPIEWEDNPDEWLSNYDIFEVLKQYEMKYKHFKIIGPTPIDFDTRLPEEGGKCVWQELCTFSLKKNLAEGKTKIGVVFNLDKHNESGSHWVSLFIDLVDSFIFYFDSAGNEIPEQINVLVQKIIKQGGELKKPIHLKFHEIYPFEHQQGNTECGMYSLFFIISMLTNKAGTKRFSTYKQKIKFFKTNRIPDKEVFKYRNKYFNDGGKF